MLEENVFLCVEMVNFLTAKHVMMELGIKTAVQMIVLKLDQDLYVLVEIILQQHNVKKFVAMD